MRKIITLTAAAVALACTQACAATTPGAAPAPTPSISSISSVSESAASPAAASPAPASPAAASPAAAAGVLSGRRQVFFFPLDNGATVPDSVPAVTSSGRIDITEDFGDRALFVPVPKSPGGKEFLVKTGKLRAGGEALCAQVQGNGSNPLTLVTKPCDAGEKDQLFKFQENGRDKQDRMTYLISVDGIYLHYSPNGRYGLIVQESGEGDDLTSFVIIDRGQATLPALD